MKITDFAHTVSQPIVSQYLPGTGFEFGLRQECESKRIAFKDFSALDLVENTYTTPDGHLHKKDLPDIDKEQKTLWVVRHIDHLNSDQQMKLMEKLKPQAAGENFTVVISTLDLKKMNPEVLKDAFIYQQLSVTPVDLSTYAGLPKASGPMRFEGTSTDGTVTTQLSQGVREKLGFLNDKNDKSSSEPHDKFVFEGVAKEGNKDTVTTELSKGIKERLTFIRDKSFPDATPENKNKM